MAGIYVHIPFCAQACYYCDFHFSTSLKNQERVVYAIKKEISYQKKYLFNQEINTIYFGGGTPSILSTKFIQQILEQIKHTFSCVNNLEITLEANPEDISNEKITEWISIGINRVSLGVQSFRDRDLKYMNRVHNKQQSLTSLELLCQSSIQDINVDLIYGFPKLSNYAWQENLQILLSFDVSHISCYSLTVEKNTPLYSFIQKGKYQPMQSQKANTQFLLGRKILINAGYEHYEISNFAYPGYKSKHNTNYWNKTSYLGLGPSAHSFNGKSRQWNIKNNIIYCQKIEMNHSFYELEELTSQNIINEYILTSLRTSQGMNMDFFNNKLSTIDLVKLKKEIKKIEDKGLIYNKNDIIYLTESGMLLADSISAHLFLI